MNIGGTGVHVFVLATMKEPDKTAHDITSSFVAKVTKKEGRLPKGRSHVGPTTIKDGFKAAEPNRCPGDFEMEVASLSSESDSVKTTSVRMKGIPKKEKAERKNVRVADTASVLEGHFVIYLLGEETAGSEEVKKIGRSAPYVGSTKKKGKHPANGGCASNAVVAVLIPKEVWDKVHEGALKTSRWGT